MKQKEVSMDALRQNSPLTIKQLCKRAYMTAVSKGFWDPPLRTVPELIALAHSELSEALEEARAGKKLNQIYFDKKGKPCGFVVEYADLLIRIGDTCAHYNLPIERAIRLKMAYNKTRSHKHGKKF